MYLENVNVMLYPSANVYKCNINIDIENNEIEFTGIKNIFAIYDFCEMRKGGNNVSFGYNEEGEVSLFFKPPFPPFEIL